MHEQVEEFRRRLERHFGGRPGRGARYPEDLRAEAVELARAALGRGESLSTVATEIGVGVMTLSRWMEDPPAVTQWRSVEVRGFDGLAATVRALGEEPLSGHLYVFRNRRGDRAKILFWDRTGFCLWYKRLQRGVFHFPAGETECLEVEAADLMLLLEGIEKGLPGPGLLAHVVVSKYADHLPLARQAAPAGRSLQRNRWRWRPARRRLARKAGWVHRTPTVVVALVDGYLGRKLRRVAPARDELRRRRAG